MKGTLGEALATVDSWGGIFQLRETRKWVEGMNQPQ